MEITIAGTLKLLSLLKNTSGKKTIREHLSQFLDILTESGSPVPGFTRKEIVNNASLTDEEFRDLTSFHSLLQELKSLSLTGIVGGSDPHKPIPVSTWTTAIRQLLLDRPGDPGTSDTGILLTGIREAAHQHYRIVFLISLNEGAIPRLSTRLPFTTSSENSRMDTRTLSDILRQEKYQFIAALLSGDEQVYLSYYEHKDERTTLPSLFLDTLKKSTALSFWGTTGTGEGLPVPFLCGTREAAFTAGSLLNKCAFETALTYLGPDELLGQVIHRITIERNIRYRLNRSEYDGIIGGDPAVKRRLSDTFGGNFTWSASMLETYAKCPFRFYLERVVRIRPLPDLGSDIPPDIRGSLIHAVLSRFYRLMKDSRSLPIRMEKFEEARAVMREIAEEEFIKVPYASPLWLSKKQQMAGGDETGEGVFDRFIRAEADRLSPDGKGTTPHTYTPHLFEFSFGAVPGPDDDPGSSSRYVNLKEIADEWNTDGGDTRESDSGDEDRDEIRFVGKIDRVDITPDNLFGIVDYKTGIHIPGSSDLSRGTALQLPLYLLAYWKISGYTPVFGSYYQIQRKIDHTIPLYDPTHKTTLPRGRLPRSDPRWYELLSNALLSSCSHVQAVRDGTFPIHAGNECKKDWYCPYKTICRFQPDRGSRLGEWFLCPDIHPSAAEGEC